MHTKLRTFDHEEVASTVGHADYVRPRPVEEQIAALRSLWPQLEPPREVISFTRQEMSEGMFVAVAWQALTPERGTYGEALELALAALHATRPSTIHTDVARSSGAARFSRTRLCQLKHTQDGLCRLAVRHQRSTLLPFPGQFGIKLRGISSRLARHATRLPVFAIDPLTAAIMLLTHPERLQRDADLQVVCAGCTFSPMNNGQSDHVLRFFMENGLLRLDAVKADQIDASYGFPSGQTL